MGSSFISSGKMHWTAGKGGWGMGCFTPSKQEQMGLELKHHKKLTCTVTRSAGLRKPQPVLSSHSSSVFWVHSRLFSDGLAMQRGFLLHL